MAYLLVSRGEAGIDGIPPERSAPLREAEQRAAAAAVGVRSVQFLDYQDGVIEYGPALRRDLAVAIRQYQAELIITTNHHELWGPGSWTSADHRAVGRAVLDAAVDAGNRWIFPPEPGEPPAWTGVRAVAVSASPHPSHAVDISGHLNEAVASLRAHHSYLRALSEVDPGRACRAAGTRDGDGGRGTLRWPSLPILRADHARLRSPKARNSVAPAGGSTG